MNHDKIFERLRLKKYLESECLCTIDAKLDRLLEIEHNRIIGDHHFASASAECIKLYRDGYFIGTVMMSHAINEGIIKFVAEKSATCRQKTDETTKAIEELINELREKNTISTNCADASLSILKSYRNDVHHMNPVVSDIPFEKLAQLNIKRLSAIENEIFGCHFLNGALVPHQPKYWNTNPDGTIRAWLRLSS
jgi:hypothetical protein